MTKNEIFAIIDDELDKRNLDTFLLWDFPNDIKKRIEELDNKEKEGYSDYNSSLDRAIIEFEKHLEDDPNNEWLKREIEGLKLARRALERLDKYEIILSKNRLTKKGGVEGSYVLKPDHRTPRILIEGQIYDKLGELETLYNSEKNNQKNQE